MQHCTLLWGLLWTLGLCAVATSASSDLVRDQDSTRVMRHQQPSLWDVLSTTKTLKPHKDLWALLPSVPLRTLTHTTAANLTIILSEPLASIASNKTCNKDAQQAMQRFVAPIRPRGPTPAATLFDSAHGLAYALGTTLVGAHTSPEALAALGEVNSVLGVLTDSWLPLTFTRTTDDQVVVEGVAGVAGTLGKPTPASNGAVYVADALPLPAPSVAMLTQVTPMHVQLLVVRKFIPAAADTCAVEEEPGEAVADVPTMSPVLWAVMGLLLADLVLTMVLAFRRTHGSSATPQLMFET